MVGRVLEITFVAVLLFLVVTNADGFARVTTAIGSVYSQSVRTLQGR